MGRSAGFSPRTVSRWNARTASHTRGITENRPTTELTCSLRVSARATRPFDRITPAEARSDSAPSSRPSAHAEAPGRPGAVGRNRARTSARKAKSHVIAEECKGPARGRGLVWRFFLRRRCGGRGGGGCWQVDGGDWPIPADRRLFWYVHFKAAFEHPHFLSDKGLAVGVELARRMLI
jgi:hypothetical protein